MPICGSHPGQRSARSATHALIGRPLRGGQSFRDYPTSHDFFVGKLEIDGLWLIDMFGGAAIIKPAEYFAAN